MKKILFCALYLLGGTGQFTHSMESGRVEVKGYITVPKGYRPLIIKTQKSFVEFTKRKKMPAKKEGMLYILQSDSNGSIEVKEFILHRFFVFKIKRQEPTPGFHQIVLSDASIKISQRRPPLIEQYAEFIKNKYKGPKYEYTTIFKELFYADANELAKIPQSEKKQESTGIWNYVSSFFVHKDREKVTLPQPKKPLLMVLKQLKSEPAVDYKMKTMNNSAFEHTNIFVDDNVTLEQLRKHVNPNIEFKDGIFYLQDTTGLANDYVTFKK
jgi:hypothetical protein